MARFLMSIDDDLLRRVDAHVARLGSTRSAYVAQVLDADLRGARTQRSSEARRALARAREVCRDVTCSIDSTELVRQMRDGR